MCWWSSLGGTCQCDSLLTADLSPRRFSRDVASLSPGILSRRRFGLDGSPLLDFERSTEDLLSLSTADLSPRRFSRDVASLSPGLLSRRRFGLDGSPLLDFKRSTEDLLSHRQRFTEYEGEEGELNMGHDYSYSQLSESEEYGGETADSIYSETEDLIRRDQAEIRYNYGEPVQYPPQPEVEFEFPQTCYCGSQPVLATSYTRNDPGRRYYTCDNVDDGECHVWKWWDVTVMEEMRARDIHTLQLAEKVEALALLSDYETQQKLDTVEKMVCELAKKKSRFTNGFEYLVGVMVFILVLIGMLLMFK
ncbi:hypothetical protein F2Q70_00042499 [Brassica cretica]|uniref:GRF-type domain-containing protein n=1 Tax=Brassica cretica TaxID=69181 RepID=A0A8S9KEC1_BRACR|nr:hypothetical protein F2Q70_00042499 [Brassica cretica]KAF3516243.1 hypothetical protein DY000_02058806 [Brassica cretica]